MHLCRTVFSAHNALTVAANLIPLAMILLGGSLWYVTWAAFQEGRPKLGISMLILGFALAYGAHPTSRALGRIRDQLNT